ncbi:hypothetical protein AKO1_008073, partial [Acrasis kona]
MSHCLSTIDSNVILPFTPCSDKNLLLTTIQSIFTQTLSEVDLICRNIPESLQLLSNQLGSEVTIPITSIRQALIESEIKKNQEALLSKSSKELLLIVQKVDLSKMKSTFLEHVWERRLGELYSII